MVFITVMRTEKYWVSVERDMVVNHQVKQKTLEKHMEVQTYE